MMTRLVILALMLFSVYMNAQEMDSAKVEYQNLADKLMVKDGNLTIGGYGEVNYNQPLSSDMRKNGTLDVNRLVMLFGYKFSERAQFITEIEFEHVKEVYIEQAFLQYKINKSINFRGGLLLIPMGIINEYHEPTTFNGVLRPLLDNTISPTTWREIGFGFNGNHLAPSLKYQVYMVNGFSGYTESAGRQLNGKSGFRNGRQKGAQSYISSPNFTAKVEYYGIKGLNIGLSGYFGNTQSSLYNNLKDDDLETKALADSSVVGISMVGVDFRYSLKGLQLRGQFYYSNISNTLQYNTLSIAGNVNDLGSAMGGYYLEAAYNVLRPLTKVKSELVPFVRYEEFNTHYAIEDVVSKNLAYHKTIITTGLGWKMTKGSVLKADLQFVKTEADSKFAKVFSAGLGVMF